MRATLEQWRMLLAIADHGGFAQAAAAIHKSQSSINHAVHKLQDQLGLELIEVIGRKTTLTEAGELMCRRARQLLDQAEQMEELAEILTQGVEAEIRIAIDEMFPPQLLAGALQQLSCDYPHTRVQLMETILYGGPEKLLAGEADLIVASEVPQGFLGEALLEIEFVAVAQRDHPLHQWGRPLNLSDLEQHRQVVVRDSASSRRTDSGWLGADQRWTVSHVATSVDMICQGTGFAWLPLSRIADKLQAGDLLELPLEKGARRRSQLYLTYTDEDRAGPATCHLGRLLREAAAATE